VTTRRAVVALIIGSLDIGGAEQQLVSIVNALPPEIEPVIFVLRDKLALAGKIVHPRARIRVIGIRARWDLPRWLLLLRELRALRPAVVHSHMLLSNLAARALGPLSGHPRVINHEHGLAWGKGALLCAIDGASQRLADRILVVSRASRDMRIERMRLDPARVSVLPNAVDCATFGRIPAASSAAEASTWGVASRLHAVKRIELALELLARARALGSPNRLLVAGDGEERRRLEQRAVELGLTDAVEFLGAVSDMSDFYRRVDLLLLTSRSEDCPVAVIEALACGKFVAATAVGGVPELLEGRDGLLIEEGSDLGRIAARLAAVPPGYDSPANRAAARSYDVKSYVERLLGYYGLVLDDA
jgi:glycosyltransferase involved in cell wall biosynthesis